MPLFLRWLGVLVLTATWICCAQPAQVSALDEPEPFCSASVALTMGRVHTPLTAEYIWTARDAAVLTEPSELSRIKRADWKVEPHFFRKTFTLATVPAQAALYIAGPRSARVWLNGQLAATLHFNGSPHMGFATMTANVAPFLRTGSNLIAIDAVRGYGSHHHTNSLQTRWLNSGEVLVIEILPAAEGIAATPLLQSNGAWRSTTNAVAGWQLAGFDDAAWNPVTSLGAIESDIDFFQWNADAGMYAWPGYFGEAPYMANCLLPPVATTQTPDGLLFDFGRELNGRLLLTAKDQDLHATVRIGESVGELQHAPFLGDLPLEVPAGQTARGPKAGFRYALVENARDATVSAESIFYPAQATGSFRSSDARLNRIWQTAVDTAHLSMQDSILDGIKRDRGRWIGDDEVIHRVVADIYGDPRLVRAGLEDAIGTAAVTGPVNGLPGYSAWWVISEFEYVQRWGDLDQLRSVQSRMVQLLALMERDLDARHLYAARDGGKPFVDWSPGLSSDSPESRRAVHFEYLFAFRRAAALLRFTGDSAGATHFDALANAMNSAAQANLIDPTGAFGDRWQTNAIAVLAGAVQTDAQREAVWRVLARTVTTRKPSDIITPYYGSYLLSAMAALGHREEALAWMRAYWGGMLDAGATSFWEAWDPAWAGPDPHARLQADDKVGYYASLSHGWSSGPAAWLIEQVLGITPLELGYRRIQVRPDLAGLQWAQGAIATPRGPVRVKATTQRIAVNLPAGITAEVLLAAGRWICNGRGVEGNSAANDDRIRTTWNQPETLDCVRQAP
ncbi:MAG: alpha-L-rhamnosidase [Acidobacteriota bacterium]|nr:alpha-L-rhamnosidase [Acidobacteriota bacterium]